MQQHLDHGKLLVLGTIPSGDESWVLYQGGWTSDPYGVGRHVHRVTNHKGVTYWCTIFDDVFVIVAGCT